MLGYQSDAQTSNSLLLQMGKCRSSKRAHVTKTKDFRWQSPGHLKNQDRTLREYRRIAARVLLQRGETLTLSGRLV